ncbi:MAG: aquaporin family protein [Planctomycetota bacterium]|nr:aquaporin family protein [Planctomycetota bacterium]
MAAYSLVRRAAAEALATAFLLAVVVGSGIMGERLAGGNVAVALLANTLATGAGLFMLILAFGPVSGAHMNPVVTLAEAARGKHPWADVPAYVIAQVAGALLGVWSAHMMFELEAFAWSQHARAGLSQAFSEGVATFGLLAVIFATTRARPSETPHAVAAYITAAYWFTASTSFANPAVTLARACTDTFSGIRPADVPAFLAAQALGAVAAVLFFHWLFKPAPNAAPAAEPLPAVPNAAQPAETR